MLQGDGDGKGTPIGDVVGVGGGGWEGDPNWRRGWSGSLRQRTVLVLQSTWFSHCSGLQMWGAETEGVDICTG